MVITGLLLIAGICLGLGLLVHSAPWLVVSLVATAAAGFLVYRMRGLPTAPRSAPDEGVGTDAGQVWVVHGLPRYHLGSCAIITDEDAEAISFEQATEDGFMPCSTCEPHPAPAR